MKKIIQILCLVALSMILTGMVEAGVINQAGQQLKKVRTSSLSSSSKVAGFETYYGDNFKVQDIAGYKKGTSAKQVLKSGVIKLKNGQSYTSQEVEYAYVAGVNNKAPHERAPQHRSPNKKSPHI